MSKRDRMLMKNHYLRLDQVEWLERIADKTGSNASVHIREAIDTYKRMKSRRLKHSAKGTNA